MEVLRKQRRKLLLVAYQIEKKNLLLNIHSARLSIKFARLRFTATCETNYFGAQINQFN